MKKKYLKPMMGMTLALSLTAATLGGCGQKAASTEKQTEGQTAAATDNEAAKTASKAEAPDSGTAMGRFLESEAELPEEMSTVYDMKKLESGSIRMVGSNKDGLLCVYDSKDGGTAWEKQEQFSESFLTDSTPGAMAISPDGSVWASYLVVGEGDSLSSDNYLISPEGVSTKQEISIGGTEDTENYVSGAAFLDSGTVILQGLTQAYKYDVATASVTGEFPDMGTTILGMIAADGKVVLVTGDQVAVYDGESLAEEEVSDSVKENILTSVGGNLNYGMSGAKAVAGVGDGSEEGGMYYLDSAGLFHQTWNGSVVEQLMDGSLSSLSDPSSMITAFEMTDPEHFLVSMTDGMSAKVLSYEWSKDTPAKPETELHVYSLYDNPDIRQAALQYQKENPDVYVELEVGLSGEEGASSEDVLKTLNTEIMAGNGPDLLLLDSMNVESYIEKGILTDLSDALGDMSGFYSSVVNTYAGEDGSVPAIPLRFQIPVMFTTDESNFDYDTVSKKEKALEKSSARGLLVKFWNTCGKSIQKEDGTLDEEALRSFLESVRTMKGEVSKEELETYTSFAGVGMSGAAESSIVSDLLNFLSESQGTAVGTLGSAVDFQELISVREKIGAGTYQAMPGTAENVFVPTEVIGVNSKSPKADAAKEFVAYLMSDAAQSIQLGEGFSVNKEIFKKSLSSLTADSGISLSDTDGNILSLEFVVPSEEDVNEFCALADTLSTPSVVDQVLKETILEQGTAYLSGQQDLDTTVSTIMQKMNLYLSE